MIDMNALTGLKREKKILPQMAGIEEQNKWDWGKKSPLVKKEDTILYLQG